MFVELDADRNVRKVANDKPVQRTYINRTEY